MINFICFNYRKSPVTEADVLLHVVDLSHPAWLSQITSVQKILKDMPPSPELMVFNKIDQVEGEALEVAKTKFPNAVFISASRRLGLETLKQKLQVLISS
jgi:GTP-binding protein HflX